MAGREVNGIPWPDDFPDTVYHARLDAAKRHPQWRKAKAGDAGAAAAVVADLVDVKKALGLVRAFPGTVLVPVMARERAGRNQLPNALAGYLGVIGGLDVESRIVQANRVERTGKGADYRMAYPPTFAGEVEAGRRFILVDDLQGMGGTFSQLRQFIEARGGEVVAATTLTFNARRLPPDKRLRLALQADTRCLLDERFGLADLGRVLYELGIYTRAEALTNAEGRFVLSLESLAAFRDRVLAAREG